MLGTDASGCDILTILMNGDPTTQYYEVGWRDLVITKAAYFLSLIQMGVTC
jgi:hypothetical protein